MLFEYVKWVKVLESSVGIFAVDYEVAFKEDAGPV
jgi:hypothetical protein